MPVRLEILFLHDGLQCRCHLGRRFAHGLGWGHLFCSMVCVVRCISVEGLHAASSACHFGRRVHISGSLTPHSSTTARMVCCISDGWFRCGAPRSVCSARGYAFSYAGMSLAILKAPVAPSLGRSAKLVPNHSKPSGFAYSPDSLPF